MNKVIYLVRIISRQSESVWYSLGEVFLCFEFGSDYVLKKDYDLGDHAMWRHINKSDCKVLGTIPTESSTPSEKMINAFIEKCGDLEEWEGDHHAWHEAMGFFFQGYIAIQDEILEMVKEAKYWMLESSLEPEPKIKREIVISYLNILERACVARSQEGARG